MLLGLFFNTKKHIFERGTEETAVHKLDQTMYTQLNYNCLLKDSTSVGLLLIGNACTLILKVESNK